MVLPPRAYPKIVGRISAGSLNKSGDCTSFKAEIDLFEAGDNSRLSSLGGLFFCGMSWLSIIVPGSGCVGVAK